MNTTQNNQSSINHSDDRFKLMNDVHEKYQSKFNAKYRTNRRYSIADILFLIGCVVFVAAFVGLIITINYN